MLRIEREGQRALAWMMLCAMPGVTLWMFGRMKIEGAELWFASSSTPRMRAATSVLLLSAAEVHSTSCAVSIPGFNWSVDKRREGRAAKREAQRRPAPAYAPGGECGGDPAGGTLLAAA